MEEGARSLPLKKSINLSLQIIITILTILKLFINFHESNEYSVFLIIDIIINFIILVDVNIIPFLVDKIDDEKLIAIGVTLAFSWAISFFTGLISISYLDSNDYLGIHRFIIYGRMALIPGFAASSEMIGL